MEDVQGKSSGMFSNFNSRKFLSGTKDFLSSNSIVAKFAFLLLVIIVFIILLQAGIYFMGWLFSPSDDPILLKCMHSAKTSKIIYSDPNLSGTNGTVAPILRSKNDRFGLEYTWSTWLYVEGSSFTQSSSDSGSSSSVIGKLRPVFNKATPSNVSGSVAADTSGVLMGDAPGVYLQAVQGEKMAPSAAAASAAAPSSSTGEYFEGETSKAMLVNLVINTGVIGNTNKMITVEDIPLNKWFNVVIRVKNQNEFDIYINGSLIKRTILQNVIAQNQGNVYVCHGATESDRKWDGYISDLRYYNYALGTNAIMNISNSGPNTNFCDTSSIAMSIPPYLSTRWYFQGTQADMYNP